MIKQMIGKIEFEHCRDLVSFDIEVSEEEWVKLSKEEQKEKLIESF